MLMIRDWTPHHTLSVMFDAMTYIFCNNIKEFSLTGKIQTKNIDSNIKKCFPSTN